MTGKTDHVAIRSAAKPLEWWWSARLSADVQRGTQPPTPEDQ